MDLLNSELSFVILNCENHDRMMNFLWARGFKLAPLKSYWRKKYYKNVIAIKDLSNNELRNEVIYILDKLNIKRGIIKYKGEDKLKRIDNDGTENKLDVVYYNTNDNVITYIYDDVAFSLKKSKEYWTPKSKNDFKMGMIVEYFNKDNWVQHKINNPSEEWDGLFKLLLKYNKVRIPL